MNSRRVIRVIAALILLFLFASAFAEEAATDEIAFQEWDWDNESVNAFSGSVELSSWNGQDITLRLECAFAPQNEETDGIIPKFTSVNGRRMTMLEQKDTIACTPETDQTVLLFTGSVQIPEKGQYQSVRIELTATDSNGKEVKRISQEVSRSSTRQGQSGNVFYIPYDVGTITAGLTIAAALVWLAAAIRNRIIHHSK